MVLEKLFVDFYRQQIERRKMNFEEEEEEEEEDIDEEEEEHIDEVRMKCNKITKYIPFVLIVGVWTRGIW